MYKSRPEYPAIYRGEVLSNTDPMNLGRCKIRVPYLHGEILYPDLLPWARPIASTPISENRGNIAIPSVGDIVWVMFEGADKEYPVYLGGTYLVGDLIVDTNKIVLYTENGDSIMYDRSTGTYSINTGSTGVVIDKGQVTIVGNVNIKGNLEVSGSVNSNSSANFPVISVPTLGGETISGGTGGSSGDYSAYGWISSNEYLNQSSMENNATRVYYYLKDRGWSKNAIAGLLGNMQRESTINPGLWQNRDYGNIRLGYGLVQWTPSTNYTDWANQNGYDITDGDYQLKWIDEMTVPKGQWIATKFYSFSFDTFKSSTRSPEDLASAFLLNFERAGVAKESERRTNARTWYNYISSLPETIATGKGQDVIDYARQFIGNKYVWGGTSLTNGCDCSGFVQQVYAHFGVSLPRTSKEQRSAGREVSDSQLQPGDLVCYDGHVGLYSGDGKLLHASNSSPYPKGGIKESNNYKYRNVLSLRRILD